jgi:hypothetical protein
MINTTLMLVEYEVNVNRKVDLKNFFFVDFKTKVQMEKTIWDISKETKHIWKWTLEGELKKLLGTTFWFNLVIKEGIFILLRKLKRVWNSKTLGQIYPWVVPLETSHPKFFRPINFKTT